MGNKGGIHDCIKCGGGAESNFILIERVELLVANFDLTLGNQVGLARLKDAEPAVCVLIKERSSDSAGFVSHIHTEKAPFTLGIGVRSQITLAGDFGSAKKSECV